MRGCVMKIVEVAEFYSPQGGGVRTYSHRKLAASAHHGHETVLIVPGAADGEDAYPGGRIVSVKAPRLPVDPRYHMFTRTGAVSAAITRERPDVLIGASPWRGGWVAGRWSDPHASVQPLKLLFMHADPVAVYGHTLLGWLFGRRPVDRLCAGFWRYLTQLSAMFDATLVGSDWLARRFGALGMARVRAVPFGVELDIFSPARRDEALRRQLLAACGLDEDALLVLTVGRHHPEKRLGTLIEAVGIAQQSRPVGMVMVGDGLLRRYVAWRAGKVPHIVLAGQQDDRLELARIMASADVLLHGSAAETYGRVLAEALASGLPVVVPDDGGAALFAGPGYGRAYRTGDAGDAARRLLDLASLPRERLSRAAHRAAIERIGSDSSHFERLYACFDALRSSRLSYIVHPNVMELERISGECTG